MFNRKDYFDLSGPLSKPNIFSTNYLSYIHVSICHLAPEYRAAGHAAVLLDPFTAVRRGLLAAHAPEL